MHINRIGLAFMLLVLLFGCESVPEKPVAEERFVDTKIAVSTEVNPDINNRPSPIVIRIYQLKNLGTYTESDFYGLFEDYESVLGSDLLSTEQFHLNPGDMDTVIKNIAPEAQYIAVIAAYRDLDRAMWRDSIIIPAEKTAQFLIFVDKLSISVWQK